MTESRLLRGLDGESCDLAHHRRAHGPLPERSAPDLLAELEAAGLRGRGGAGFPLARKLRAVRSARGRAIVIVNGCEGEPMSAKDRLLLSRLPHLVIDGATTVARAVGADEILFAVDELDLAAQDGLERALAQRPDTGGPAAIRAVPAGYLSGQESALVRWCDGGPAIPQAGTRRVTERGVARRPTLVSNAETLAHAALVHRHGAGWFRRRGTAEEPGTTLVTVSGAVRAPGVLEIEPGLALRDLLAQAGGATGELSACLIGGYAGGWVDGRLVEHLRLERRDLIRHGTRLGAGIVVALGADACPVAETARVTTWLAEQSAGQCGPCRDGLRAIAGSLNAVRDGEVGRGALADLARWCDDVTGRGACAMPDGAAAFVASALRVFAAELRDHARHGPCDACDASPILRTAGPVAVGRR